MNVKAPQHIAPDKETIQIEYDIVNVGNCISIGKLRILRASDKAELKTIKLTTSQYTHGHHSIAWDGKVGGADFPDGFVTIEHSPYIAEVSIGSQFGPRLGTAEVKVEIKNFIVEKAPRAVLKNAQDQKIWDQVTAIPTSGLQKLMLESNLFAIQSSDMDDDTAFKEFETLWNDGPRIPLRATVTVFNSLGKDVRAGKALGRARVLWDYTDPTQAQPAYLATALGPAGLEDSQGAKPFVDSALKYDTASKPPDGDNCHADRGGKRHSKAGTPVMTAPDADVTNFPFTVADGKARWWAGFGAFEKAGAEEARAGVVFRPSRMAGDDYVVTAYLDVKAALDTPDKTPTGAHAVADVGVFEVWRQITLPEHFKKCAAVTQVMPDFAAYYEDAFMYVDDQRGSPKVLTKAEYDAAFAAALPKARNAMNAQGSGHTLVAKYALPSGSASQYDLQRLPGTLGGKFLDLLGSIVHKLQSPFGAGGVEPTTWVATFRPYVDFREAVRRGEALSAVDTAALLITNGLDDEKAYAERTMDFGIEIATAMCKAKATKDGLTVLQFDWASSLEELIDGSHNINGNACFKKLNVCGFALYSTDTAADPGVAQTPAHEIGHNLFLPHAPRLVWDSAGGTTVLDETTAATLGMKAGGILKDRHDALNRNCLMSYARPRPGFCGLCLLRLRGWNESDFNENGARYSGPGP